FNVSFWQLTGLTYSDREALVFVVKAANVMDEIFYLQAWYSNPSLRDWLKEHADTSELNKLKWSYYQINKSPSSSLDEDEAFLSTADSAIRLLSKATRIVKDWKGLEYRAAFPLLKPAGANFYPPDMDKMEFELWKDGLAKHGQKEATGFFSVIKRHSEFILDSHQSDNKAGSHDLYIVPYSEEYKSLLAKAAVLLHKAGDVSDSPRYFSQLKHDIKILNGENARNWAANVVLKFHDDPTVTESEIAVFLRQDSKLDVTIGPYETYEDKLFGYKSKFTGNLLALSPLKRPMMLSLTCESVLVIALQFFCATFEAYIGIRDDEATAQLKLLGDYLLDVKGPQTLAFNLPNDEHIVKDRGSSMVMLKNVSEAKFKHILLPIAAACVAKEQQEHVDFESFFTRSICHECCHGIGPHTITLPNGQKSTELQEFYSALEEAKADIVGLWALRFLISQDLLSDSLLKSMYVSFLAGCFQSVRFGLEEAHGKGQALQFNWLYEKGAFVWDSEGTISVDFTKIEGAIESLSREILTIQAKGDKENAGLLLQKYCVG
ncbi:Nudix hydrolase 3, partial [Glycine soja]